MNGKSPRKLMRWFGFSRPQMYTIMNVKLEPRKCTLHGGRAGGREGWDGWRLCQP